MTTTPATPCEHPLLGAVARVGAEFGDMAQMAMWSLTQVQSAALVVAATKVVAMAESLQLRAVDQAVISRVEDLDGATSTANWWAHQTHVTRAEAHRKVKLIGLLSTHTPVAAALEQGRVLADQASVIVDALEALPDDLDAGTAADAQTILLRAADVHDAKALRQLGKAVLSAVAPEIGEALEAAALEKDEREAAASARFSMVADGHGKVHGRFTLPELHGAMLHKALLAYAAPRHRATTAAKDRESADGAPTVFVPKPGPEKMGTAFMALIEGLDADKLPHTGGTGATVVVTMELAALMGGLKHAVLDTGETISAAQARLLACQASLIPLVLGTTKSEVLDQGRATRFFTRSQRIRLGYRDGGCTAEGCDWPPGMCHAHHDRTWVADRGSTDISNGRLLCPRHHARVHDTTYDTTHLPGGKIAFTRRT